MAAFATPLELEAFIGGEAGEPSPRGAAMLELGAALLRRWTGQTLSQVVGDIYVTRLAGDGSESFLVPQRPVTAVTSVTIDGTLQTGVMFTRWGKITHPSSWGDEATVVYTHGYVTTDPEWEVLKLLNMGIAARALTWYRSPQFEELGGAPAETAGFAPEVFLSVGEQKLIADLGKVPVG